ncbi:hypothetical protein Cni_G02338 [Canna indica]|uniref:Copine C-terminal domain-containing protein n=1 Tax=Canna indica TaxID=4628 RepID=A0AAQ3Q003_9LILI|nr:hypothetical protein Cni_G02338 [Canna indica]
MSPVILALPDKERHSDILRVMLICGNLHPLAFAPKVVLCASDPPKDNEAGVGCSFGCRCEGCKNNFDRRDGKFSFSGRSLHHIGDTLNPYEPAISIIGRTLSIFDEDNLIPCFGFGDGYICFGFYPNGRPCDGFQDSLRRYRELVPDWRLAGTTSKKKLQIHVSVSIKKMLRKSISKKSI